MPKVLGTPTVRFNLQNPSEKESTIVLIFRYTYEGKSQRLKYSPGLKVKTKYWDEKSQFPKRNPHTTKLIGELARLEKIVLDVWEKENLPAKEFREELRHLWEGKPKVKGTEGYIPSFHEFVSDYVLRKKDSQISRGTWKNLNTWKNHLADFVSYQQKELTFDGIDREFRENFIKWCYVENNHSMNYVRKGLTIIRQFMAEAEEQGFHSNGYPQTKSFLFKKLPTSTIALSKDELQRIYDVDLSAHQPGYEKARTLFLIGAYTGLRHSDYKRIQPDHIIFENDSELISILAWKSKKFVKIPLHPNLKRLLEECEFQAPDLSQQKLNKYIKEVAKLASIVEKRAVYPSTGGEIREVFKPKYELIGSHTARRTFATQARINGWPTSLIRAITGHSSESQLDNYIDHDMYLASVQVTEFYKKEEQNE